MSRSMVTKTKRLTGLKIFKTRAGSRAKNTKLDVVMGDFDDNDPLEDLLRDASAGTFKRDKKSTAEEVPKFGVGSTANLLEQPKRTRKSVLMAELFSTPSDSVFDELTAGLDRNNPTATPAETPLGKVLQAPFTEPAAEEYVPSFGGRPLSSSRSRFTTFKPDGPVVKSAEPSVLKIEERPESYVPTAVSRPASTYNSSFSTFRPPGTNSDYTPLEQMSAPLSSPSTIANNTFGNYDNSTGSKPPALTASTLKPSSFSPVKDLSDPPVGPNQSLKLSSESNTMVPSAKVTSPIRTNVGHPVQDRQMQQNPANCYPGKVVETISSTGPSVPPPDLSKIEEILENFVTEVIKKMDLGKGNTEGLNKLSNNLEDVSLFLKEIAQKQSISSLPRDDSKLEERLDKLEIILDKSRSENAELKMRLEKCEFLLSQEHDHVLQVMKDFDHLLDIKLDVMSTQCRNCQSGTEQKLQALESELSRQRKELESRLEKTESKLERQAESSGQKAKSVVGQEVSEILNAELKWLQKWKQKLGSEQKQLGKLRGDIQKRIDEFDRTFQQIGEMKQALDEDRLQQQKSAQHLSQQWLRLQQKEENLFQVRKELGKDLTPSTARHGTTFGVDSTSIFKLLIEEDEKLLKEQEDYISSLKNKMKNKQI